MNTSLLLHWHYLVFLVPFGLSAALLLLSALRVGHGHGHHAGHGHAVVHGASAAGGMSRGVGGHSGATHGPAHGAAHRPAHAGAHGSADGRHHGADRSEARHAPQPNVLVALLGVGRAPLPMVVQAFFMVWGLSGCLAIQMMLGDTPYPSLLRMLPVMGIAAGCGLVGARIAAELIARLMPQEESSIVSREGLYGLKGSVAFPVTETGGRIMVYDDFGSLHDETCRVAPGHPPIERGRKVLVMDRDTRGYLLVEEVPD